MFDFRLKVFYTVAKRLNFTKAANELYISQPAVTKHIKEIEQHFQCKLFDRSGAKIKLTVQGKLLLGYAEKIALTYKELHAEIAYLNEQHHGLLKIGTSTTAAQYILPQYLAKFKNDFPGITLEVNIANTERIENLLYSNKIDIGIVEGKSKRSGFNYMPFLKDEIVLCTQDNNLCKPVISVNELKEFHFLQREKGSGTLEIIADCLRKKNIKLSDFKTEMILENNESIKSYLLHSTAFAFLSIYAINEELKSKRLKIIDIKELNIERYYHILTRQGEQNKSTSLFIKNIQGNNFRL